MAGEIQPIQKKMETLRGTLVKYQGEFEKVLPKHIPPERFGRVVLTEVSRMPKLLDCTPPPTLLCCGPK